MNTIYRSVSFYVIKTETTPTGLIESCPTRIFSVYFTKTEKPSL